MDISAATLTYFVALADELHFACTAEKLHISPPSPSQQIDRLEAQVGRGLLVRSPRAVHLTPAVSTCCGPLTSDIIAETLQRHSELRQEPRSLGFAEVERAVIDGASTSPSCSGRSPRTPAW